MLTNIFSLEYVWGVLKFLGFWGIKLAISLILFTIGILFLIDIFKGMFLSSIYVYRIVRKYISGLLRLSTQAILSLPNMLNEAQSDNEQPLSLPNFQFNRNKGTKTGEWQKSDNNTQRVIAAPVAKNDLVRKKEEAKKYYLELQKQEANLITDPPEFTVIEEDGTLLKQSNPDQSTGKTNFKDQKVEPLDDDDNNRKIGAALLNDFE